MSKPTWDTPARLNGLPCANWKQRTGVTMDGTFAECVARWLSLADHHKRDCTLGFGPTADGQHGSMGFASIGAYICANGLPPLMAAERGGQPSRELLEAMTQTRRLQPAPAADGPISDSCPRRRP